MLLHIDGLLHLTAMAVAISIAYMGVDRISGEPDRFHTMLLAVTGRVRELVLQLDVKQTKKDTNGDDRKTTQLKLIYDKHPMHVLCFVAKEPISLGWYRRLCHTYVREKQIPLLGYFRHRFDRKLVTTFGILSLIAFFAISYISVWDSITINLFFIRFVVTSEAIAMPIFILSTVGISWILFSASVAYKLFNLDLICQGYEGEVRAAVEKFRNDVIADINHFNDTIGKNNGTTR